tara:strand:- start:1507 stop:1659 length:153 start_codon:yes stop_codon:yes gene_type:complete
MHNPLSPGLSPRTISEIYGHHPPANSAVLTLRGHTALREKRIDRARPVAA